MRAWASIWSRQAVVFDSLIEIPGGGLRCDAKLSLEQALTVGILAQGGRTLLGPGIQPHQLPVGRLVERVECQPAPRVGYGRLELALPGVPLRQPFQGAGQVTAELLSHSELPGVEGRAVAQGEAGKEFAAVELHGGGERRQAG